MYSTVLLHCSLLLHSMLPLLPGPGDKPGFLRRPKEAKPEQHTPGAAAHEHRAHRQHQ